MTTTRKTRKADAGLKTATEDKWTSLIEACEMGSESGAATVLKHLRERDELLSA